MSGIARTRSRRSTVICAAAIAAAGVMTVVVPAAADSKGSHPRTGGHGDRAASYFAASLKGANEVPVEGGPATGDKDGVALEFVRIEGTTVSFAVKWRGTDKPTALHIHQGARGTNGGLKIDFTARLGKGDGEATGKGRATGKGKPMGKGLGKGSGGWRTATGAVEVADAAVLADFKANPTGFYANLHTAEFPGGAVRGQFHRVTDGFDLDRALHGFQARVVKGEQIYTCREGADGTRAYQQHDVRAVLAGGIAHSFVRPGSGTPQWVAPDRSAVTGSLIARSPNGAGNIPELDLRARSTGAEHGRLARTTEILRLNTVGGTAPAGDCEPGALAAVPYRADYVFIQR
ncbi:CHRD domain-containing protein [Streptomyces albidochromogenes]|uniref:CHRD domain-containing protein n=1 Tax=Streptomyces albidochromogenes TaxID=329524 RepID=A0ABW6FMN8_9ACTN